MVAAGLVIGRSAVDAHGIKRDFLVGAGSSSKTFAARCPKGLLGLSFLLRKAQQAFWGKKASPGTVQITEAGRSGCRLPITFPSKEIQATKSTCTRRAVSPTATTSCFCHCYCYCSYPTLRPIPTPLLFLLYSFTAPRKS